MHLSITCQRIFPKPSKYEISPKNSVQRKKRKWEIVKRVEESSKVEMKWR
jgi:hypothetical protein